MLRLFSKLLAVGHSETHKLLNNEFLDRLAVSCVSSCEVEHRYIQKAPSYPTNIHANLVPMGIFYYAGHYCSSQSSEMGQIIDGVVSSQNEACQYYES